MSTTTFDPFRSIDRTFDRLLGEGLRGASATGSIMPMDLYRSGESFVAHIDLPGVDPSTIDIDVEDRTLPRAPSGSRANGRRALSPASSRSAAAWPSTASRPTTATASCR